MPLASGVHSDENHRDEDDEAETLRNDRCDGRMRATDGLNMIDRPFDGWCCRVRFILDTGLAMGSCENVPNAVSRSRSKSQPGCTPTNGS
jgi:hypothetical protein